MAKILGVCVNCIRTDFEKTKELIAKAHIKSRKPFGLPLEVPNYSKAYQCRLCSHFCKILENSVGYCGLPASKRTKAKLTWYYDPLPTNCVASFVCSAGTGKGYPQFAYRPGPEYGYDNLAIFYEACSFDCLFCQNWSYRISSNERSFKTPEEIIQALKPSVACICFFGGDPTPQLPHSLIVARLARKLLKNPILRICWETNGNMHPALLDQMVELAIESGGCIKFDLKAWSEELHIALTGTTNRQTLENFKRVALHINRRPIPPLLVASTLLIPGYIDEEEVYNIARFISSLNPTIPYSLLAFYPQFMMDDLPPTSKAHAERALNAATKAGLVNVHIGNKHLLWDEAYD